MKKSLLAIVFVAATMLTYAADKNGNTDVENAQITINGQINDQETNETLVGVKVTLKETGQVAYTDFDGNYSFNNIKPGVYNVSASYISYEKSTVGELNVSSNSNQVNISLKSSN